MDGPPSVGYITVIVNVNELDRLRMKKKGSVHEYPGVMLISSYSMAYHTPSKAI